MQELIEILKLTEKDLKNHMYNYLLTKNTNPIYKDGYIYSKGDIPILLVAHMDTVLRKPVQNIIHNKQQNILYGENGIGGDDRCGVYIIKKILENFKPHVLLTEGEEIGGVGARKAIKTLKKPNVKYIIELDRKGNNDCVFYDCGNEAFIKYINKFGFETQIGTFSDICILSKAWDIASVNLSSGYYNEHTSNEYINLEDLNTIIKRVKNMIKKHNKVNYFDYQEIQYNYGDMLLKWKELYRWLEYERTFYESNTHKLTLKNKGEKNDIK